MSTDNEIISNRNLPQPEQNVVQSASPLPNSKSAPAVELFQALFDDSDTILIRPIETWTEDEKKQSRVDYHNTCYVHPTRSIHITLMRLQQLAIKKKLNLFFGVCPRFGSDGKYDLAWQIRKVCALWTDIDHVTVDEVSERLSKAKLPHPTAIVNSGNGVHLYWLLDTPFLIDDVGDPPPIEIEWIKEADGRKKPRKYFIEDGDRVYLDKRGHVSRLSPKAEYIQDLLAGIAKEIGGDHTTDLSRLLRLPGTCNRKDERNGREPILSTIVECDSSRKYPLSVFEALKSTSPTTERTKKILAMPLPKPRKVSASKADKLAELIAASAIAEIGSRSEPDFAVCCYAVRHGIAKAEVWSLVQPIGKFAEKGERYFDHTWGNAEWDTRVRKLTDIEKRSALQARDEMRPAEFEVEADADEAGNASDSEFPEDQHAHDGGERKSDDGKRKSIVVDPAVTPVATTLNQITSRLLSTGTCYSRADQLVAISERTIRTILSPPELAGLLSQFVEFYFVGERSAEYKPLPATYANTWLNNHQERNRLQSIRLFSHNPVYTEDWRLVAPGYDTPSGIYYAGPAIEARSNTEHLDALLRDFCFKSPGDRTNYIGMLLTAMLVPRFIGSKPAALFNGNQPELGKSILAQIIAILRDGQAAETASYNPNDEEFEKRLGSIVRNGATTIIVDNAKGYGRNPRIESPCLERSITDATLSFRLLGHSASIRAENSHIFCITANAPDVSRDLVTRSVIINLFLEGDPERREFSIPDPEGYAQQHRFELLGELIGMVERWKSAGMRQAKVHSRFNKRGWGTIVGGILEACGEPDFLDNAEEAATLLDETRREFGELVEVLANHSQGNWTASELVDLCRRVGLMNTDLGEGSSRSLATKMGTLAGRYVGSSFTLADGREVLFQRTSDRKGNIYRVVFKAKSAEP